MVLMMPRVKPGSFSQMSVSTAPGCRLFTVTPVNVNVQMVMVTLRPGKS